jgi:hypothetical protein
MNVTCLRVASALLLGLVASLVFIGCSTPAPPPALPSEIRSHQGESFGSLEVIDPKFLTLIELTTHCKARVRFDWRPIWISRADAAASLPPNGGYLLFSDVPSNTSIAGKRAKESAFSSNPAATPARLPAVGSLGPTA